MKKIKILSEEFIVDLQEQVKKLEEKNDVKVIHAFHDSGNEENILVLELTAKVNPFFDEEKDSLIDSGY